MPSRAVMNFWVIVIVLISAQENYGLTGSGPSQEPSAANNSTFSKDNRPKRYIDHFNPLFRQMDFLKKDECRPTLSGDRRFFCPSMNEAKEWICVTMDKLCDTKTDCPNNEDEDETMCMFHRHTVAKLDDIAARLQDIQHLLSQQLGSSSNYNNNNNKLPRGHMSADEIQNRLEFEYLLRNSAHQKPEFVPSPEFIKNDKAEANEEAEADENDTEEILDDDDYTSLTNLQNRARELLLMQSPYHQISINSNPTHPFNQKSRPPLQDATPSTSSSRKLYRRDLRHPWNQQQN